MTEPKLIQSPDQLPDDAIDITGVTDPQKVYYSPSKEERYIADWVEVDDIFGRKRP